jgi:hypothetical protein
VPLACALICLSASPPTQAESDADRATARGLAQQGLTLKKQGNCRDALGLLQQAQSIYDAPTHLLAIGQCQAQLGQLVEAAETYRKLGRTVLDAKAPPVFRSAQQTGEKELADLVPRIATLIVDVAPLNIPGLVLRLDGETLLPQVIGAPRPVNPGPHQIEAEAPGYARVKQTATLKEGEKQRVTLPLRQAEGTAAPTASGSARPAPTEPAPVPTTPPLLPPAPDTGPSRRTMGYVIGGLGAVSTLLGGYFGLKAISKKSDRDGCQQPDCSSATYNGYQQDSLNATHSSNLFFGVGVVGLGAGVLLVLTAPPEPAAPTTLRLGPGSIHLAGSFLCARFLSFCASFRSPPSRAVGR